MRKLQYLFMTLSVLFLATPAFAQAAGGDRGPGSSPSQPALVWASPPGFAALARAGQPLPLRRRWLAIPEHAPASCCCSPLAWPLWSRSRCSRS